MVEVKPIHPMVGVFVAVLASSSAAAAQQPRLCASALAWEGDAEAVIRLRRQLEPTLASIPVQACIGTTVFVERGKDGWAFGLKRASGARVQHSNNELAVAATWLESWLAPAVAVSTATGAPASSTAVATANTPSSPDASAASSQVRSDTRPVEPASTAHTSAGPEAVDAVADAKPKAEPVVPQAKKPTTQPPSEPVATEPPRADTRAILATPAARDAVSAGVPIALGLRGGADIDGQGPWGVAEIDARLALARSVWFGLGVSGQFAPAIDETTRRGVSFRTLGGAEFGTRIVRVRPGVGVGLISALAAHEEHREDAGSIFVEGLTDVDFRLAKRLDLVVGASLRRGFPGDSDDEEVSSPIAAWTVTSRAGLAWRFGGVGE